MTNTEFIAREKKGRQPPQCEGDGIRFGLVEGVLIVGFLAAFIGLVLLLSK